ncbi:MAG: rubrerythrin [Lachnospiraceae bacterium]|nr:rubrerythrin [Lachnospiraceae bacterium]
MNDEMKALLKSQQGELDGVETYLMLADVVRDKDEAEVLRKLAADEGRHAAVFKNYTGKVLKAKKGQGRIVKMVYRICGKKFLYPIMAKFEYGAIPKYEKMMKKYPEIEGVKNDEKRHGDTLLSLLDK